MVIYGPYKNIEGRLFVVLYPRTGEAKTVSYPKYLFEKHLGRILPKNETVHHKDGNFLNNDISNLEVIDRATHAAAHVKRNIPQKFECPFCSKSCSGQYGAAVQNNRCEKLNVVEIKNEYYTNGV